MELELGQLELRYERLRRRDPRRERQLVASLAEMGQLLPIVVLAADGAGRHVVVDGYKRVRALGRLRRDTVRATVWELEETEALLLERLMRTAEREGPLEQGWLLCELRTRFGLGLEERHGRLDDHCRGTSRHRPRRQAPARRGSPQARRRGDLDESPSSPRRSFLEPTRPRATSSRDHRTGPFGSRWNDTRSALVPIVASRTSSLWARFMKHGDLGPLRSPTTAAPRRVHNFR